MSALEAVEARLDRMRGDAPPRNHDARSIAALTTNPGCRRRALLDAAGADKAEIARFLGHPPRFGQSQFAITRGNAFEATVKADGCAALYGLLRDKLGLPVAESEYADLEEVGGNVSREVRYARTKQLLKRAVEGEGTLFDHPLLRVEVGGHPVYLEPDVIAFRSQGAFHVVEIKSFPVVDGRANPEQVAAAARQAAVYVLALRLMMTELGYDEELVADRVVLVCPENFTNRPTATLLDVRPQLGVIRRQLQRMQRIEELLAELPEDLTLEPGDGLAESLPRVPARYMPGCRAHCDLSLYCRAEARACASTDLLGRQLGDQLGGITDLARALRIAEGEPPHDPALEEVAEELRDAHRLLLEQLEQREHVG
ncbi:hypothetical protein LO762_06220 [Actinocorallia sp. API 0066]|uniref:hypothetical protein n=1 Tax=Actinocorallia sp. API 0066 TaxID=2896846 RepID=UPI001E55A390|nr:hypothetical protein [Actinocorallia sp. API 0066]MCD0448792.1 hypothetical protein [Actinocorallia sp. API 0066]